MKHLLLLLLVLIIHEVYSQNELYFPPTTGDNWETVSPAELGWCPEKVDSLLTFVEAKNSKSLIILKDGKIVLESYFGTYTRDSLWYWASAGKSLMGVLVGLAQEDGYLNIENPVSNYLGVGWTSCSTSEEEAINIRHQISMSSGLDDSLEPSGSIDNCFTPECFQCIATPGTRWAYHNSAYRLSQDVLENATGINKNLYTRNRLGNRIGMKGFWFDYIYFSTARDMARFGLLVLNQGQWASDPVMSDLSYFNAMVNTSQAINESYGYLWWLNGKPNFMLPGLQITFPGKIIPSAPDDLIAALGKNDQKIYVVPSQNLVVIRQGLAAGTIAPTSTSFDNQFWERMSNLTCVTATEEQAVLPAFAVFPNPAKEMISVFGEEIIVDLELWDARGKILLTEYPNAFQVSLSLESYPTGYFWLRIRTEKGISIKRIVKY